MNKVFKKVLDKRTGQFVAVSETAKSKTKTKATTHGAINEPVKKKSLIKAFFKASTLVTALSCTSGFANAAISNVDGNVGGVLSSIYNSFEQKANITLSSSDISRLDNYLYDVVDKTLYYTQLENPDFNPETDLEIIAKRVINKEYYNIGTANADAGKYNSNFGSNLSTYGSENTNIGVANTVSGILNKTTGIFNTTLGSDLNVVGSHNVAVGTNASTVKDTGGLELNLQTILQNNNLDLKELTNDTLGTLYKNGTMSVESLFNYYANSELASSEFNWNIQGSSILGQYNTTLGSFNNTNGNKNSVYGNSSTTVGNDSVSLGNVNFSTGDDNTIVGSNTKVEGNNNTILSANSITAFNTELKELNARIVNSLSDENSSVDLTQVLQDLLALEESYASTIKGDNNISIGSAHKVQANNTVNIGNNITNNADGSVAIGNNITVDASRATAKAYLTDVTAENQVMFGGQRFTEILDGVADTDGVALRQLEVLASGYYTAHAELLNTIEALNLNSRQDRELLLNQVKAIIHEQKEASKIEITQDIDTKFGIQTSGMKEATLLETMNGVEGKLGEYAANKYSSIQTQALSLASAQQSGLVLSGDAYANTQQESLTNSLTGLINLNKEQLDNTLSSINALKNNDLTKEGESLITSGVNAKDAEGTAFINEQDEIRKNNSLDLIDDLASRVPQGGGSNSGLGSKDSHWEALGGYTSTLDTNVLSTAKDKAEIETLEAANNQKDVINTIVDNKVQDALLVGNALNDEAKAELLAQAKNKDAVILADTNEKLSTTINANTESLKNSISAMDDITLQAAKNNISLQDQESLNRLGSNFDVLDNIALNSGKNTIQTLDSKNYENIQSQILKKDELNANQIEQYIKKSITKTESDVTDYISSADTAIWDEFQKHIGTGGGVVSEESAIAYANSQDVKIFNSSTILADSGDKEVLNKAKAYADNKLQDLSSRINERDSIIQAGVAGAYALAGLPQASYPGQAGTSWAMASKAGQSAVAVGFSAFTEDSKWLFKSGATADSKSKFSGGASVTRYILP